jgi:ribosomal protein L7/L12
MDAADLQRVNERLRALEWNTQRALAAAGLTWEEAPPVPGVPADVLELVRAGNTIAAIKRYRELTGAGLGEAKAAIEGLA